MDAVVERVTSQVAARRWLVRLRWHAVAGIVVAAAVGAGPLGLALPLGALAALAGLVAVSNLGLARARPRPWLLGAALVHDAVVLAALLALTGGPSNPFALLFLLLITMAAQLLAPRWIATVVVVAMAGYLLGFVWHAPLPALAQHHGVALAGALLIGAGAHAMIVGRTTAALRAHQAALDEAQRRLARAETLAAVGTLATGAAHELGTPLGAIAIAAADLEELIHAAPDEAADEARAIRAEVDRCRRIVDRMATRAGVAVGELPRPTRAGEVLAAMLDELGADAARVRGQVDGEDGFRAPVQGLVQVLTNLVRNAIQVSDPGALVFVRVERGDRRVRFVVDDEGPGFAPEVLARVGEPFVTTRPGVGMGLGLYVSRSFAELCGGALTIAARAPGGTRVTLELPGG